MALKKNQKTALILAAVAVGIYLVYRWYESRSSSSTSSTGTSASDSNLNSTLTGLSAGPSTELNYYGNTSATYTAQPVTVPARNGQWQATQNANGSAQGTATRNSRRGNRSRRGMGSNTAGQGQGINPGGPMQNSGQGQYNGNPVQSYGNNNQLPTPVYNNGQEITTISGFIAALKAAGQPYTSKQKKS